MQGVIIKRQTVTLPGLKKTGDSVRTTQKRPGLVVHGEFYLHLMGFSEF